MPRPSKPCFRKQTKSWYCSIQGRQISLGKDREEAFEKFHSLMANQDSFLELASESLLERQARYSGKLLSSHVGWVVSTYLFFFRQLDIFRRVRLIIDDVLKVGASTYPT